MKKLQFSLKASSLHYGIACFCLILGTYFILMGGNAFISVSQLKSDFHEDASNFYKMSLKHTNETEWIENTSFIDNSAYEMAEMDLISYHLTPVASLGNQFKGLFFSSVEAVDDFIAHNRVLIEGEMIGNKYVDNGCIISDELARANNLHVGSVLTFLHQENWHISLYFRVVGIYKDYTDSSDLSLSRRNEILIDFNSYEKLIERYANTAAIPVNRSVFFSMDEVQKKEIQNNLSSQISLTSAQEIYQAAFHVLDGYEQLIYLQLILGSICLFIAVLYLLKKIFPLWRQCSQLCRQLQINDFIYHFMFAFTLFIPSFIAVLGYLCTYPLINEQLLNKGIRYGWLFTKNSSGIPVADILHPYYVQLEECLNSQIIPLTFVLLGILLLILFAVLQKKRRNS